MTKEYRIYSISDCDWIVDVVEITTKRCWFFWDCEEESKEAHIFFSIDKALDFIKTLETPAPVVEEPKTKKKKEK